MENERTAADVGRLGPTQIRPKEDTHSHAL